MIGHTGRGVDEDELRPFPIESGATAGDIVERMGETAFQARNLGQATRIWDAALRDEATIFLGLAGAMVPAGMRPLIVYLIENRLVDVIVSTGANLYHDVYETLGFEHGKGDPHGDDMRLAHLRVVRFYDVLAQDLPRRPVHHRLRRGDDRHAAHRERPRRALRGRHQGADAPGARLGLGEGAAALSCQ